MSERLRTHMETRGVEFYLGAVAQSFNQNNDNKVMVQGVTKEGEMFSELFDTIILDVGRCANTYTINLEDVGIETEPKLGKVIVNEKDQTSVSNVFAIGDCSIRGTDICPLAKREGQLLARRLYSMSEVNINYCLIPNAIFTTLEYGFVGASEEEARQDFGSAVEVYHDLYQPYKSRISHRYDSRSYTKMITVQTEGGEKIIGVHILGPNAGEIIQGYALALKLGATKQVSDSLASAYPTNGEFVNELSVTASSGAEVGIR